MSKRKVDPKLLEILVCPLTKGPLDYDPKAEELISEKAGLAFPIRDGIPVLLIEEARLPEGISSLEAFKERFKEQIPD